MVAQGACFQLLQAATVVLSELVVGALPAVVRDSQGAEACRLQGHAEELPN